MSHSQCQGNAESYQFKLFRTCQTDFWIPLRFFSPGRRWDGWLGMGEMFSAFHTSDVRKDCGLSGWGLPQTEGWWLDYDMGVHDMEWRIIRCAFQSQPLGIWKRKAGVSYPIAVSTSPRSMCNQSFSYWVSSRSFFLRLLPDGPRTVLMSMVLATNGYLSSLASCRIEDQLHNIYKGKHDNASSTFLLASVHDTLKYFGWLPLWAAYPDGIPALTCKASIIYPRSLYSICKIPERGCSTD